MHILIGASKVGAKTLVQDEQQKMCKAIVIPVYYSICAIYDDTTDLFPNSQQKFV